MQTAPGSRADGRSGEGTIGGPTLWRGFAEPAKLATGMAESHDRMSWNRRADGGTSATRRFRRGWHWGPPRQHRFILHDWKRCVHAPFSVSGFCITERSSTTIFLMCSMPGFAPRFHRKKTAGDTFARLHASLIFIPALTAMISRSCGYGTSIISGLIEYLSYNGNPNSHINMRIIPCIPPRPVPSCRKIKEPPDATHTWTMDL